MWEEEEEEEEKKREEERRGAKIHRKLFKWKELTDF